MKKIAIKCFIVFLSAIVISLALPSIFIYRQWHESHSLFNQASHQKNITGKENPDLMSHRMITVDVQYGVTSPVTAAFAYGITQAYFDTVKTNCMVYENKSIQSYLTCANKILGQYFYYKPSDIVSEGWSQHYSDCDLNVYLLLDTLHRIGKTARIVYAPGHAFLSFDDEETRFPVFWESTKENNTGGLANLRTSLYIKNPFPFYYSQHTALFAEQFYPVLLLGRMKQQTKDAILQDLMIQFPNNPFLMTAWFSAKPSLTASDADKLKRIVDFDITTVDKRLLLGKYFLSHNNITEAKKYLNQIDMNTCDINCLSLKSKVFPADRFLLWINKAVKRLNIPLSSGDIYQSLTIEFIIYSLILFVIFLLYTGSILFPQLHRKE
ncbi:hypothetical protein [Klebsiella aerogenes]|uniref:hypothetical protein n=1 Tax=Klebsiella aerogenes TaxID=548 RepID=UPI0007B38A52|nr:hypothetical protein [Klebsiella aerogenes]ELS5748299.1 hypothetical protein [Klebsiella aerogenes]KZR01953.1 hypothetical protein A3N54_18385 [Klebsiella aerogenes]RNT20921.1 hypothetical protein B9031_025535 [Klebsiella aerogenes]